MSPVFLFAGVEALRPGDHPWYQGLQETRGASKSGTTTEESARIKALEREVAELRRANDILKAAASFFAAELDRPPPRS